MYPEWWCSFCFKGVSGASPTFMKLTATFTQQPDQADPSWFDCKLLLITEPGLRVQPGPRPGGGALPLRRPAEPELPGSSVKVAG